SPRAIAPGIPLAIEQVCLLLMAMHRDERPATMLEVVKRLENALVEVGRPVPRRSTKFPTARTELAKLETAIVPAAVPQSSSALSVSAPSSSSASGAHDLAVPGRFGRYELERLIGRGGMGTVYLAREVG